MRFFRFLLPYLTLAGVCVLWVVFRNDSDTVIHEIAYLEDDYPGFV